MTESTDPDWVPIMKKAAGLITNYGGTTSHAAIVSRELGIARNRRYAQRHGADQRQAADHAVLRRGRAGIVYEGILEFKATELNLAEVPQTKTAMMVNIASPAAALRWWRLPAKGIGLARMEFIINNIIKIHPMALVHFDDLKDHEARRRSMRSRADTPARRTISSICWRAALRRLPPRTTPIPSSSG